MIKNILKNKSISLAAAWSFNQLAYAIVYPFIPIYLCTVRGYEYSTVSIIFPLLGLANILAPLPCGWMTDKFGYSFMMFFGQAGRGLLFFILAFLVYINAPFWVLALFLMLNTSVGVAFQVGSDAYLFNITKLEERPSYYSKIRMGFNLGWTIGPMLGAFFAQTPFWMFFIITGVLCIFGTIYTSFICCKNTDAKISYEEKQNDSSSANILIDIFGNKRFLMLLAGTLFLAMLASQLYSTMSIFSTQHVGITSKALGFIYSLNGFMVLTLQIPLVALLTKLKVSGRWQLLIGTLLYAAGYFNLGFANCAMLIAVSVAVITVGEVICQPALYTAISCHTAKENAGRMFSAYALMRGIGYAVGPWIGGQLFGNVSPLLLWSVLASFGIFAALEMGAGSFSLRKSED